MLRNSYRSQCVVYVEIVLMENVVHSTPCGDLNIPSGYIKAIIVMLDVPTNDYEGLVGKVSYPSNTVSCSGKPPGV